MNHALEARVALALARVMKVTDSRRSDELEGVAYEHAHSHGMAGGGASEFFAGEPLLQKACRDGREEQELIDSLPPARCWQSEWTSSCDGRAETRAFVIQDEEGYRAGLDVSYGGGESLPSGFGKAHVELALAIEAANKRENDWHMDDLGVDDGPDEPRVAVRRGYGVREYG